MSREFSKEQQEYLRQISKFCGFTIGELRGALSRMFEAAKKKGLTL